MWLLVVSSSFVESGEKNPPYALSYNGIIELHYIVRRTVWLHYGLELTVPSGQMDDDWRGCGEWFVGRINWRKKTSGTSDVNAIDWRYQQTHYIVKLCSPDVSTSNRLLVSLFTLSLRAVFTSSRLFACLCRPPYNHILFMTVTGLLFTPTRTYCQWQHST